MRRFVYAFSLMNWQGKTPADMGLPWDEVDPRYDRAIFEVKAGYERGRAEEMKN